jgi:hypothetical protein
MPTIPVSSQPRKHRSHRPRLRDDQPVHVDPSKEWTRSREYRVNGRTLVAGTEVKIKGERGRFRFYQYVRSSSGSEWLDFVGGPAGHEVFRSFSPDRVQTVHRISKTRASAKF